jgi:hypothetical protein
MGDYFNVIYCSMNHAGEKKFPDHKTESFTKPFSTGEVPGYNHQAMYITFIYGLVQQFLYTQRKLYPLYGQFGGFIPICSIGYCETPGHLACSFRPGPIDSIRSELIGCLYRTAYDEPPKNRDGQSVPIYRR